MKLYSIAIDGPAASGKSTAAKGVSKALGFLYIDTGARYRAFTLYRLREKKDTKSREDAISLLPSCHIEEDKERNTYLNGENVSEQIRTPEVSNQVSYACAHLEVREKMVALQREMAKSQSVVRDGRDIGTVVLPNADLKVYQIASAQARAKRRYEEFVKKGIPCSRDEILKDIQRRDYIDSHRENSPLTKAEDAIVLDTSDRTIEEETKAILSLFEQKAGIKWKN